MHLLPIILFLTTPSQFLLSPLPELSSLTLSSLIPLPHSLLTLSCPPPSRSSSYYYSLLSGKMKWFFSATVCISALSLCLHANTFLYTPLSTVVCVTVFSSTCISLLCGLSCHRGVVGLSRGDLATQECLVQLLCGVSAVMPT